MANIEVKTEEWLSADDLQKDPEFPSGTAFKIRKALALLENDPEFRENIQTMKANGQICKCLHVSKKTSVRGTCWLYSISQKNGRMEVC